MFRSLLAISRYIYTKKVLGGRIIANVKFLQLEKIYEQTNKVLTVAFILPPSII